MSDNPFEEDQGAASKNKKGFSGNSPMSSITGADINKTLKQIRWINLGVGVVGVILKVFSILSSIARFNFYSLMMNCFCILFLGILVLYEMQMKKGSQKLRRLYGFLYTYIGRAGYLIFVGSIAISSADLFGYIGGAILLLVGVYNLLIFAFHPAFKNGNRKLSDDPTQTYSSGESEITNVLKSNPKLAQKMLVGASKFAS